MAEHACPLRIVHVITDLEPAGSELALLRLVEATADRCNHHVISLSTAASLRHRFEAAGALVTVIGLGRRVLNPVRLVRLGRVIRAAQPHVIQTWLPAADLLGGVIGRLATNAPVVWNLRCSDLAPERSSRTTRLVSRINGRLSRRVPARIVAVGHRASDIHAELHYERTRIVVIENGFRLPSNSPDRHDDRRVLAIPLGAFVVSRLGRFHPDKDHPRLIEAWAHVTGEIPEAILILAGNDMDEANADLAQLIELHGVNETVRLLGLVDDPTAIYTVSDATVSNSLSEGFPNVIGEAMALGIPPVVTDVGDSARLVGDSGIVVPSASPVALAQAIISLHRMSGAERVELGDRARDRIANSFSMDSMARRYVELWNDAAGDVRR
jgi:glycosyltransferase involved in cell wall biosynthesis